MRSIADDKGNFTTHGNSNGVYDQMQKNVKQESRERFNRKPWYLEKGVVSIKREKEDESKSN